MNRFLPRSVVVLLLFLSVMAIGLSASDPYRFQKYQFPLEVTQWLIQEAHRVSSTELGEGFEDLEPLREMIGDARIVGLGEGTHGTHEFQAMRNRLVKFLVAEMGFSVIAFETSGYSTKAADHYIKTGEGTPEEIARGLYGWPWQTSESAELISWLQGNPSLASNALCFVGLDGTDNVRALTSVIEYVQMSAPSLADTFSDYYTPFFELLAPLAGQYRASYAELGEAEKIPCREGLVQAHEWLLDHQEMLVASSGEEEFLWHLYLAYGAIGFERAASVATTVVAEREIAEQNKRKNIQWLLEHVDPNAKIIFCAHNGHVSLSERDASYPQAGALFRETFGSDYIAIGTTTYDGALNAMGALPSGGTWVFEQQIALPVLDSIEYGFRSTEIPRFYLDLRLDHDAGESYQWISSPHPMQSMIGAIYQGEQMTTPLSITKLFDIVFHFQNSRATTLLWPGPP